MSEGRLRFLITGCSGGGKSSLLAALAQCGYSVVKEPGRQIVRDQIACGGDALPWKDKQAFGLLLAKATMSAYETAADQEGVAFFDRGAPDVFAWFEQAGGNIPENLSRRLRRIAYDKPIFVAPPWKEIYRQDAERPKPFEDAVAEYDMIVRQLELSSLPTAELPHASISERVQLIENRLS